MLFDKIGFRQEFVRHVVTTAIIALAGFFIIREVLKYRGEFSTLFREADLMIVLLLFGLQIFSFFMNAVVSTMLFKAIQIKASFFTNLVIAIGNKLGNKLMPVMGGMVTGFYSYKKMLNLSTGTAIFLIMAWTSFQIAAYAVIVLVSAYMLPAEIIAKWPSIRLVFTIIFAAAVLAVLLLLKDEGENIKRILRKGTQWIGGLWRRLFKKTLVASEKVQSSLEQIDEGLTLMARNKYRVIPPLVLSIFYYLMDITILYFSFRTFGYSADYAVVALAFVGGAMLALFDPAAGSPGVSEAAYILAFVIMGIPTHIALLGVLLFRIVTYWIWVPFSFIYLIKLQRRKGSAGQAG